MEQVMRKILLAAAGAATILSAGAFVSRTEAMPLGSAVGTAAETVNPVEKTSCWRWGRFGWGWYPCGYYYAPSYSYGYGYGPRFYGGYGYGWRHRWHHWWR
jgi:hypothetical protein